MMADNNIDELSLLITTSADGATAPIQRLADALAQLGTSLAPVATALKSINTLLGNTGSRGASARAAISEAGKGADGTAAKLSKAEIALRNFNKAMAALNSQRLSGNLNPVSPLFSTQLAQAKKQISSAGSQLAVFARESNKAFDGDEITGYMLQVEVANRSLAKLSAQAAAANRGKAYPLEGTSVVKTAPATMSSFAQAPLTAAPVAMRPIPAPNLTGGTQTISMLGRIKTSLQGASSGVEKFSNSLHPHMKRAAGSTGLLTGSFIKLRSTIFFTMFALGGITAAVTGTIGKTNAFIETQNRFNVVMGKNKDAAQSFIDTVSSGLGFDPAEIMQAMANFQAFARSIGVAEDSAFQMSKALTALSYDLASFYDVSPEQTIKNLQSGLLGQTKAVYKYGIDITNAQLKTTALTIAQNVNMQSLNQATKAQLRLITMLRQTSLAQGDMARTLNQPTNALRVFKAQLSIAARMIGALFIPALSAILPYAIAVAQVIQMMLASLMRLLGIKMPDFTVSWSDIGASSADVDTSLGGVADKTDKAAKSAGKLKDNLKKIRDYTLGIDELNVITPETADTGSGAGGGGGGGVATGGLPGLDDALSTAVDDYISQFETSVQGRLDEMVGGIREKLKERLKMALITGIGGGILGAMAGGIIFGPFGAFIGGAIGTAIGAGLGLALSPEQLLKALQGVGIGAIVGTIAGSLLGPVGSVVGGILGAAIGGSIGAQWQETMDNIKFMSGLAWNGIKTKTAETWATMKANASKDWGEMTKSISTSANDAKKWVGEKFDSLKTKTSTTWSNMKKDASTGWSGLKRTVGDNAAGVFTVVSTKFDSIKKKVRGVWDGLKDGLSASWDAIKGIFKRGVNYIIDATNSGPIKLLNTVMSAAKRIDPTGLMKGVATVSYIPRFATGGFPTVGSTFIAGEAGPELVGSFGGNNNTVMPLKESGFVQAMSTAVYGAVASAMQNAGGGGSTSADVYLDADKVGKVLDKSNRRKGTNSSLVTVG